MRRIEKRVGSPIWLTIVLFSISFFSLSAIPFCQNLTGTGQRISGYIIAALFWFFLMLGFLFVFFTKRRQQAVRRRLKSMGLIRAHQPPGIISFSSNPFSIILYVAFLIEIFLIVSDMIFHWIAGYIMFPIISVTLFTFMLHCMVDGENYKVYQVIKKGMDQNYEHKSE